MYCTCNAYLCLLIVAEMHSPVKTTLKTRLALVLIIPAFAKIVFFNIQFIFFSIEDDIESLK